MGGKPMNFQQPQRVFEADPVTKKEAMFHRLTGRRRFFSHLTAPGVLRTSLARVPSPRRWTRRLRNWLLGRPAPAALQGNSPTDSNGCACAFCIVTPHQLRTLTQVLTAEQARARLPNLLVVEQTLQAAPSFQLAAVPDFVLAKSLAELQSLKATRYSDALQTLYLAMYAQAVRNEEALVNSITKGFVAAEDFLDTEPMDTSG
jgi:hypothetical protein